MPPLSAHLPIHPQPRHNNPMLGIATWTLAAAVAIGMALACLWLAETKRPRWATPVAIAHGLAATSGTALLALMLARGLPDLQNFAHLATWMLAIALAGGLLIALAALRHRRPNGLVVALHATLGLAGFVMLLAYASLPG